MPLLPLLCLLLLPGVPAAWRPVRKTRTVRLKQGVVVGTVYQSDLEGLGRVEVYRGVPYAHAERFMPPSSPARFDYLEADRNGPVCPQNLVELDSTLQSGRSGSGRLAYLRRLIPFLKEQSEDCLNLNIYVPAEAYVDGLGANLNVIVFIHGESFSWNSGNPYDGSTLASYGHVIFVTLNYRLGLLGFLNTRNNKTTSNFGLLDQIAALRWLKDNIAEFGGDPNSITLMGHHTGAIAVNYLMLSPVTQGDNGLFQRAIMMSGTALSGWAQSRSPEKMARAVAEQTRCPPDDLLACLREKRLHEILAVRDLPEDPAPSVDGIVVKIQPKDLMSHNNDLFTRYDLLCGVTESESYHILDSFALKQGLFPEDIKELLSKFFKENFERWEQCQEKAMKVYGLDKPTLSPMDGRDSTLTLLSDARVVAPMVQTAVYHSTPGKRDIRTYFYVFAHQSKHGDHPLAGMSVQGEDLAYVLGVPLEVGLHHFPQEYSQEEKHLSETIMSLWVNFAKTGDPNIPKKRNYLTSSDVVDVEWSPYEPNNQVFYQIQIPPRMGTKYRDNLMHFWNHFLPTWKPPQVPLTAPNKYTNSLNPEDLDPANRLRFFDMYNPFVPASRTTTTLPPPVAEESVLASESLLPLLVLASLLLLLLVITSALCIKFRKRMPWNHGRSASLPSIEFDVDEVLAALEREKAMSNQDTIPRNNRVVLNDEEEEEIQIIDNKGPPVSAYIPKEPKKVPKKPKRTLPDKSTVKTPERKSRDEQNEARLIDEPEENVKRKTLPNIENNYDEDIYQRIDHDSEKHENGMSMGTCVDFSEEEKQEDALDKIKRSNFPKVLPDFPNMYMEFEGNSTHEKRIVPISPGSIRKKYVPPSPPRVPAVLMPRKDRARNVVPNFLEFHSKWSTSQYDDKKVKKQKDSKGDKTTKLGHPSKRKESVIIIDEEEKIDLRPRVPMETFNSNIENLNAASMESGIYFAQPARVISDDNSMNSFPDNQSDNDDDISDILPKNDHTKENELALLPPLLAPLEYFRRAEKEGTLKDELENNIKSIPSKLSQARKMFCKELEKVLQKQVGSQEHNVSKTSEIDHLMRKEMMNKDVEEYLNTSRSNEIDKSSSKTSSENYKDDDDQRSIKSTGSMKSSNTDFKVKSLANGKASSDDKKSISSGGSKAPEESNDKGLHLDSLPESADGQNTDDAKTYRQSSKSSKNSSEVDNRSPTGDRAGIQSPSSEECTSPLKNMSEDLERHISESEPPVSNVKLGTSLKKRLSEDQPFSSLERENKKSKNSLEINKDNEESVGRISIPSGRSSKSPDFVKTTSSVESKKSSTGNGSSNQEEKCVFSVEASPSKDSPDTLIDKDYVKSAFEKRKMFADSKKTDAQENASSSSKAADNNKSVKESLSQESENKSDKKFSEIRPLSGEHSMSETREVRNSTEPSLDPVEGISSSELAGTTSRDKLEERKSPRQNTSSDIPSLISNESKSSGSISSDKSLHSNGSKSREDNNFMKDETSRKPISSKTIKVDTSSEVSIGSNSDDGKSPKLVISKDRDSTFQESKVTTSKEDPTEDEETPQTFVIEKNRPEGNENIASDRSGSPEPSTSGKTDSFETKKPSSERSPSIGSQIRCSLDDEKSKSPVPGGSKLTSFNKEKLSDKQSLSSGSTKSPEPEGPIHFDSPYEEKSSEIRGHLLSKEGYQLDKSMSSKDEETPQPEMKLLVKEIPITAHSKKDSNREILIGKVDRPVASSRGKTTSGDTHIGDISNLTGKKMGGTQKGQEPIGKTKKGDDKKRKSNKRGKGKP